MRLACTFVTVEAGLPVVHIPPWSTLRRFVLHQLYHHPEFRPKFMAQLHEHLSLSLSEVVNIIPLAYQSRFSAAAIASPASPLYHATARRNFPASLLMENVEYSAEYHRPEVR